MIFKMDSYPLWNGLIDVLLKSNKDNLKNRHLYKTDENFCTEEVHLKRNILCIYLYR